MERILTSIQTLVCTDTFNMEICIAPHTNMAKKLWKVISLLHVPVYINSIKKSLKHQPKKTIVTTASGGRTDRLLSKLILKHLGLQTSD